MIIFILIVLILICCFHSKPENSSSKTELGFNNKEEEFVVLYTMYNEVTKNGIQDKR